ncbi:MAG TPA: glycosyltransferase family 2 protein [Chryseolinea sp.]|nr:glycosyltransferase family 2 protein [Chryseolinea sp.]
MMYDLTVSIVLFKNNLEHLNDAIKSALDTKLNVKLYLIDNSPTDELKVICPPARCEYIFNNANLGFGKAHNIAMRRAAAESSYHIVLNPDVYFNGSILDEIFNYMEKHQDVGQVMPKILYPDGKTQYLCKLLPAPADLFLRRFFPWFPGATERNRKYELLDAGYDKIMNIPYLSGCFMFLRSAVLPEVGYFDERIFMYIEDADLTRRIHQRYKTIFFPQTVVYHHYGKGSYRNFKLMLYNIHGAVVYFNKWGWIFDKDRKRINHEVVQHYLP